MKLKRKDEEDEEEFGEEEEGEDIGEDSLQDDPYGNDMFGDGFMDDPYTQASPLDKHKDLLKDLTNFSPYLKDSVNNWLGLTWDEEKEKYVTNPLIRPIMNIKGASWCIGFLKTYTRSNNILTYISDEYYKSMMSDVIEAVWLNLGTRNDLGIKNNGDLIRVGNEMEHAAALALMGAGEGKYSKLLSTTYSHHTNLNGNPNQNPNQQFQNPQVQTNKKPSFIDGFIKKLKGTE